MRGGGSVGSGEVNKWRGTDFLDWIQGTISEKTKEIKEIGTISWIYLIYVHILVGYNR